MSSLKTNTKQATGKIKILSTLVAAKTTRFKRSVSSCNFDMPLNRTLSLSFAIMVIGSDATYAPLSYIPA